MIHAPALGEESRSSVVNQQQFWNQEGMVVFKLSLSFTLGKKSPNLIYLRNILRYTEYDKVAEHAAI